MTRQPDDCLDGAAIRYLQRDGREVAYPEGARIVRRGEPGRAFFVVLDGEVEVRLADSDGRSLALTRLREGGSFGEMALLRGEPVSADVVASQAATVLEYPAERFSRALAECEGLSATLMTRLAQSLDDTTARAWSAFRRAEALQTLMRLDSRAEAVVAESAPMRRVAREVERLARGHGPVMVTGGPGTGKLFVARKIHEGAGNDDAPLVAVDCRRIAPGEGTALLLGSMGAGGLDSGRTGGFGTLHLAHEGSLLLQHVEALDPECQDGLSTYLEARAGGRVFPRVRVIATASGGGVETASGLEPRLAAVLSSEVLEVPPLERRRADILPLARLFLECREVEPAPRLTKGAEHALLALAFRQRNVAELREAVDLAAVFAEGGEIRGEHVFAGPKDRGLPAEYDLSGLSVLGRLVRGRVLDVLRLTVLASFVAVIVICLAAPASRAGAIANGLIWGLWEPAIIVLFLLLGHVWCTVCPLSTAGTLAQGGACLGRPPPGWVKRSSVWLGISGFFLIIWSERVFHMTEHPFASGVLLATLMALSVGFCLIYQREVWCRYVCPLGALAAGYSVASAIHVRANPSVCNTQCSTHECYKGDGKTPGCSVFRHPLYANEAHLCKLFAPFAVAVFMLGIVVFAFDGPSWLARPVPLTVLALISVVLGALLGSVLPRVLSAGAEPDHAAGSRVALSLLVLGWGPIMAYQLGNVPGLDSIRLHWAPGPTVAAGVGSNEVTLLAIVQLAVILLAALLAAVALWRSRVRSRLEGTPVNPRGWALVVTMAVLYVAVALVIGASRGLRPGSV